MRRALITGAGGQDGSYLAELLVAKGYEVYGIVPRDARTYANLDGVRDQIQLVEANLLDRASLVKTLRAAQPHEVYNLASVSFVPSSWDDPVRTAEFAAVGVTTMLEAIREVDTSVRFYQASSSEIFGAPADVPQTEDTALAPVTPYGVAKAYGHLITRSYRARYDLHASSGILYNHESPRRPLEFLPRKVSRTVAEIKLGLASELRLGNLGAKRDWGYAPDYVEAMWRMVQHAEPQDFVIATGESHTVSELVVTAFAHVGLDWQDHVLVDPTFVRGRAELHNLVGDPSRARALLGWQPSTTFEALIGALVDADLASLEAR